MIATLFEKYNKQKIVILAPIVKGRKGHYRELFEQLAKQGFLRVRVDGIIQEIKPKMQLDRYVIHDIEIVIDRLTVDKENKIRIIESIQNALKHGKDLLLIQKHESDETATFSKLLMCPETGLSYDEPNPNSFSFNSPYGSCNQCKGLGTVYQIDMQAIIPDKKISIADGGIAPLGEARDAFVYQQVKELAKQYKFDVNKPISTLSEKALNVILYGSEDAKVSVDISFDNIPTHYNTQFEGVVNMVVRWFNDTGSEYVKTWAEKFMSVNKCPSCDGARLRKESLWFKLDEKNISQLSEMNLDELKNWFVGIEKKLNKKQQTIAKEIIKEILDRLNFLLEVGLNYLSINRTSRTLSGGESQRIRLATQIGSKLQGITYILDEPSIGLHQRDNERLIKALKNLRDMGNTVIVVEHDKDIMLSADYLIDIGPGAGRFGGQIITQGKPSDFKKADTPTANFLNSNVENSKSQTPNSNSKKLCEKNSANSVVKKQYRKGNGNKLILKGATGNNLKNVTATFPLGTFICVTGVSGSGKSTLINDTFYPILSQHVYNSKTNPMPFKSIEGLEHVDKVIEIDQSPIGRTPRSNPATYCNFFNDVRQLFSIIPEAKIRGYKPGRFSFNVKGGRCEQCEGGGMKVIEMNFLPDVHVHCERCNGKRFNRETLEIRYRGKSISDVLEMTVSEATDFFKMIPSLYRKVKTLEEVGLGYITLGQSAVTLSGGEAQRVKLATELSKKDTGKTIYILDEPTTGLHFQDIQMLLLVLQKLVDRGNTVLVIEHNMDVIKVADYIIDIGPEGGNGGGQILCAGTPEEIIKCKESITGRFLKLEI
jgi:excinuclease ABC subunit A